MGGLNVGIGVRIPRLTPREGGGDLYRLFANGEDGLLFGNFGDLSRLFTTYQGPTQVANDADPVGLALEDSQWSRRTLAQQVAQAAETIRNPSMAGASPGTPGTVPTNWQNIQVPTGCTVQIVAVTGDVLRVRLSGTPTAGGFAIKMESNTQIVAAPGQVWRSYVETALVGGSLANIVLNTGWDECSAGGSYLASNYTIITPGATLAAYVRQTAVFNAGAARVVPALIGTVTLGQPVDLTLDIRAPSMKKVAGNHALQATNNGYRLIYKDNSGKPYLLPDGVDDGMLTSFNPPATAGALAVAVRGNTGTVTTGFALGGGASASANRFRIGLDNNGLFSIGWGAESANLATGDLRGADHVLLLTGDASSRDAWLDGVLVSSAAPTGAPGGTSSVALGAWNNGGLGNFFSGRIYSAMALNRRVTPAEIALITSKFRSTYQ
jgi:hypothetical protein